MASTTGKRILIKIADGPFRQLADRVLSGLGYDLISLTDVARVPEILQPQPQQQSIAFGLIDLRSFQKTTLAPSSFRWLVMASGGFERQIETLRSQGVIGLLSDSCNEAELIALIDHAEKCIVDPLHEITDTLEAISGVQLKKEKRSLVETRLRKRLTALGIQSFQEYGQYFIANRADEIPKAISLVTTHTTEFFRESEHFDELFNCVFPTLFTSEKKVLIWSAASSSGQEIYSLAIAFLEYKRLNGNVGPELEILGTDIDPASLRIAREGIYKRNQIEGLSPELCRRYFDEGKGDLQDYVRIKDFVHRLCRFERLNLKADAYPSNNWNLIFLRNTLIYFTPEQTTDIVNRMSTTLHSEGLLFLGHTESLAGLQTPYKKVGNSIYSLGSASRSADRKKPALVTEGSTRRHENLIVIGASTGGVEALRVVLEGFPAGSPPILIVQHIPAIFSETLARRLNETCAITVREARDGDRVEPSNAYIAPGGRQMRVRRRESGLYIEVNDDPPVGLHRPSVNYLFDSIEPLARQYSVSAALLTGMGTDGAQGLLKLRKAGAHTIAQDEQTSVVFGMPAAAINLGAAIEVLPIAMVAGRLLSPGKKASAS